MSNIQEVLDNQKRIEGNLLSKLALLEGQLNSSDKSKPDIDKLTAEFYDFKDLAYAMLKLLNSQIHVLSSQVDTLDNEHCRNALLFNGIQELDREDCKASILDIIKTKLKLTMFQESSIYLCHRLGTKAENKDRPIIVRFSNVYLRDLVWMEKKQLKSTHIVVGEFLTKTRQALFSAARKHFGISHSWSHHGNIYVKLPNNERIRVTNAKEMDNLITKYPSSTNSQRRTNTSASTLSAIEQSRSEQGVSTVSAAEPPRSRRIAAQKNKTGKPS